MVPPKRGRRRATHQNQTEPTVGEGDVFEELTEAVTLEVLPLHLNHGQRVDGQTVVLLPELTARLRQADRLRGSRSRSPVVQGSSGVHVPRDLRRWHDVLRELRVCGRAAADPKGLRLQCFSL